MNPTISVANRAESVRQKTLATLQLLTEKGKAYSLPEPPAALEQYRQKLADNTYQVLVVGEAKRGKSTFVNALIGRDVLPTDVDIATSQVFRICPADREAYRLRFEDDSQQTITAADLPRYGSQVMADAEGVPRHDQIIRWIEVDAPIRFLPPNVRVLDTPGLGGLYAAHAEITQRFVPHADAVIFVLDSQAPIGEPEVKFVEQLLGVTNHVFFIQTKIDQFRKEAWQEIQKRNQDILQQRFKARLPDTRVWPISSTNLRKSAETGDDDYLLVSRHKELAAALQAFRFRVAGWSRSALAVVIADHAQIQSRNLLATRLDGVTEGSRQKRTESQEQAADRRRQFDADWGERGQKRRELLENIHNASVLARQDFRQALQPSGAIETTFRERTDALRSLEDAKQSAETMPGQVVEAASAKWADVCRHFQLRCTECLGAFLTATDMVNSMGKTGNDVMSAGACKPFELSTDTFEKFKRAWSDASVLAIAGGLEAQILATAIVTSWFPPLAGVAILGAAIWAGTRGWKSAGQRQVKEAQQEIQKHLSKLLQQVRSHFFDVDLAGSRSSRVDEHFNAIERTLAEHIAKLATQKLTETQAEINRLTELAKLDDEQRKAKAEEVRRQLADWDGIGQAIKAIQVELTDLDRCAL